MSGLSHTGSGMRKPHGRVIQQRGKAARERVRIASGQGRNQKAAWYPEIMALKQEGWENGWICEAFGMGDRWLRALVEAGNQGRRKYHELEIDPVVRAPDAAMLEFTPDAYEAFFTRFSGLGYLPKHAKEWVRHFIENNDLMLNVPSGHAKTTLMVIWLTVWLLHIDRNIGIAIVSETGSLSKTHVRSVANILAGPEGTEMAKAFGRMVPTPRDEERWAPEQGELMILGRTKKGKPGDLSVKGIGRGQQFLGFRPDVIIADDITNAEIAASPAEHLKEIEWLRGTFMSRVEETTGAEAGGRAMVIGQRVAFNDLYSVLRDIEWEMGPKKGQPLWTVVHMKALPDGWDGKPLWPERWTIESLQRKYTEMGRALFNTMFQGEPEPEGGFIFDEVWINGCRANRPAGMPGPLPDGVKAVRVAAIDPAPIGWNGAIVGDVWFPEKDTEWRCDVLGVEKWKGGGVRTLQGTIMRLISEYRITHLIIEDSAVSKALMQEEWFKRLEDRLTVVKHKTQLNKNDAEVGVTSLAVDLEFERISLPCGDERGREMTRLLADQLKVYPHEKEFDLVMALWFLRFNRKRLKIKKRKLDHFRGAAHTLSASGRMMAARRAAEKKSQTITMEV